MKIFLLLVVAIISLATRAQEPAPAQTVADRIAQKMKDSLGLNDTLKQQLYQINMQLHDAKMVRRQQYAGTDSVRIYVQRVENTRDSLYRRVLNEEKYLLYIEKKKALVNNN